MGDAPVLSFTVDPGRLVRSGEIVDTPVVLGDSVLQGSLRWVVGVVVCPYCGGGHEHVVAQSAMWGWFTAGCDSARGYYLSNDQPDS